jgi:hypothetical protein
VKTLGIVGPESIHAEAAVAEILSQFEAVALD